MPYFTIPMRPQSQSHYRNTLDPFLQAVMAQLYEEEHAENQQQQQRQSGEASCHPCAPPNSKDSAKATESGGKKAPATAVPRRTTAFKPNFNVYEGAEAYYVEGDLPGLSDKKVLSIEFPDDRTLAVSGRVDKAAPQPQPHLQQQQEEKSEGGQDDERKSLKPTVEETEDEDDFSVVSTPSRDSHAEAEKKIAENTAENGEKPRKVWLAERTYGEFRRVFTFATPVEVDGVTAKLADGLLVVEVPKKVNKGVKKIEVL